MMIMAVQVPSPKILPRENVETATSTNNSMSPIIATVQPERKLWPVASAAARPVIGSTPKAMEISRNGPGFAPYLADCSFGLLFE